MQAALAWLVQHDIKLGRGGVAGRWSAQTMGRPIRILYGGAVYHVKACGSHGQEILQDDWEQQRFLKTLGETRKCSSASCQRLLTE
jgi:hypothetical protein